MSFGSNLRYYRVRKGYNLQELGEILNVSANYLCNLENDNGKLKPEFLPKLCKALNIQILDLYDDKETDYLTK